jgi:hypothetical protein
LPFPNWFCRTINLVLLLTLSSSGLVLVIILFFWINLKERIYLSFKLSIFSLLPAHCYLIHSFD